MKHSETPDLTVPAVHNSLYGDYNIFQITKDTFKIERHTIFYVTLRNDQLYFSDHQYMKNLQLWTEPSKDVEVVKEAIKKYLFRKELGEVLND